MERATAASGGSRAAAKLRGRFLKRCDRRTEGDLEWVDTPRQIPWDVSRRASTAPPSPPLGFVSIAFAEDHRAVSHTEVEGWMDCERFLIRLMSECRGVTREKHTQRGEDARPRIRTKHGVIRNIYILLEDGGRASESGVSWPVAWGEYSFHLPISRASCILEGDPVPSWSSRSCTIDQPTTGRGPISAIAERRDATLSQNGVRGRISPLSHAGVVSSQTREGTDCTDI